MVRRLLGDFDMEILFGAWRSVKVNVWKVTRRIVLGRYYAASPSYIKLNGTFPVLQGGK